jgi:bifunctional DNase/RNase
MDKVKVEIIGMSYSQSQSGAYALILGVTGENKRLPIIIGGFEAQAIAIELEKMKPARPLTHDLFKRFAEEFGIVIKEVIINKFQEGIFYSLLVCDKDGETTYIDSRTSDAVALALRFNCPIYCEKSIIDEAGIDMNLEDIEDEPSEPIEEKGSMYKNLTLEELEDILQKAVEEENYEEASKIRDEIKKRKSGK